MQTDINKGYIKAGFSKIKISPRKNIELCGYGYYLNRVSTGILDDIYSQALFLKLKDTKVLFISCDVLGISESIYKEIADEISKQLDISKENIFISATHTHCAPTVRALSGCGEIDKDYIEYFKKKIIKNAINSSKNIYNSEVKIKKIQIDEFSFNRESPTKEEVEQDMMLVSFAADKEKILLAQFSTHATMLSNKFTKVSKDYVGAFEKLTKELGFDDYIFFNGACGNLLPLIVKKNLKTNSTGDTFISSKKLDNEKSCLNKSILNQYKLNDWLVLDVNNISVKRRKIEIDYKVPPGYKNSERMKKYFESAFYDGIDMKKGVLKIKYEKGKDDVINKKVRLEGIKKFIKVKYDEFKENLRNGDLKKNISIDINLISIGDLKILTYPLELPIKIEKELRSVYSNLLILCYTNGLKGYICKSNGTSCYAKKRGSLLYNMFPFKDNSWKKVINESKELLKV